MLDISSLPEVPAGTATPLADSRRVAWLPQAAWVLFGATALAVLVVGPRWAAISFYLIWISCYLLYGAGVRPWRLVEAETARSAISAENEQLLTAQRRFLQDASHQLKTPITIALGHAELLARQVAGQDGQRDIQIVVGELNRLKSLSERLLLIASSANPDFLRPEPVALPVLAMELLRRWRPAAARRWLIGQLDDAVVAADADRLALALDALLENAVQHTGEDDVIRVSVVVRIGAVARVGAAAGDERARFACVVIEDSGEGIPQAELGHIFDRFRSGPASAGRRGTGLGLALALAIARGHGGEVRVRSELGRGSRFEFLLPLAAAGAAAGGARLGIASEPVGVGPVGVGPVGVGPVGVGPVGVGPAGPAAGSPR